MSKEITKAIILQEIQDKMKLRDFVPAKFLFEETVIPVYNIETHFQFHTASFEEKSVTAGSTYYNFFTVPDDQKWTLNAYNIVFMATGAYTVTGLYINRRQKLASGAFVYLDMKEGQTASYSINLPKPVILTAGDLLNVYVDSYTSTADLRLYIDFIREIIR